MIYGLDVHKRFVQVCAVDPEGRRERSFRIDCTRDGLVRFAGTLSAADAVVLETTFHSWEIASILRTSGARVVIANSSEVKAIAHARIKTDKIDASTLAHLLRAELIPEVALPDEGTWEQRRLITHRRLLIKQRTALKNAIRSQLSQKLLDRSEVNWFTQAGRRALAQLPLGELDRFLLESTLASLDAVSTCIESLDERIRAIARQDPSVRLLMTVPGVGPTVAVGLIAAIGDIARFPSPGQLAAYLGLVPRTHQSADRCYHGPITKQGSNSARHLAIEAAQVIARSDTPLAATFHRVRARRPHNVAVTALARKLIVVVWHMLQNRQPYRYAPVQTTRAKLRRVRSSPARTQPGRVPRTLAGVYAEAGLPELRPPTAAEKRAAATNRRKLQAAKARTRPTLDRDS